MSAAPPPRLSTNVEDENPARNDASDGEGAKRTSKDLLSSLAARERSARERAAEAEMAAQRAADHRRAAEERLARYREGRRSSSTPAEAPASAVQLDILTPAAERSAPLAERSAPSAEPTAPPVVSADPDASGSDPELLAQIDAAERGLERLIAEERRLADEIQQIEGEAEQRAAELGPAEAQLDGARSAEQEARRRLDAARSAVAEAAAEASEAQAAARLEAQNARDAVRRAEVADEQLESIVGERSSAFQRAIEHATLEQDASARASAARRAAQQAAAQRLAAEQALDGAQRAERLARLRAAIETSIESVSEGEGIEGEAIPAAVSAPEEVQARDAQLEALEESAALVAGQAAGDLLDDAREEAAEGSPWSSASEETALADEPAEADDDLARTTDSPWWLAGAAQEEDEDEGWDEGDESSRADEEDQRFLATLFSEDAFRGEAESTIAEEAAAELEALEETTPEPPAEPAARAPIFSPLRPKPETAAPRGESAAPRRERAAAELARIERAASQQTDAARKARQAEGQRVEAERDAYEEAATQWRSRHQRPSTTPNRGPGLYAEHDYAWEEQAAIGVQRKMAREDEIERRRRMAQAAAEQAVAAQRAAEQLRAPVTTARNQQIQFIVICVAVGLSLTAFAYLILFPRTPETVVTQPAPSAVAVPEPSALANVEAPVTYPEIETEPAGEPSPEPVAPVAIEPPQPELARAAPTDVAAPATALTSTARAATKPELREEDWPAWRRYAVAAPPAEGKPIIAIVIDDMGSNREVGAEVVQLPPPITVSFFPWVQRLERQVEIARAAGHEIMAHVPMEPQARSQDPGPNFLGMTQSAQEIRERLRWNLDKFDFGIVGINNHMGSRFTSSGPGMGVVMAELLKRQMLFLDSRTTRDSVGAQMAAEFGLPYAVNDLFLDNEVSAEGVLRRLDELEARARRKGSAIAIGHPHRETVEALRSWIPRVQKRGFVLVPLSAVVKHQMARRAAAAQAQVQAQP
jgi:uncharacterized protein